MQKYIKIYLDYFGYSEGDFIPCEATKAKASDIHHINGRGKGKDIPSNLMALSREEHFKYHNGGSDYSKDDLIAIHEKFMRLHKWSEPDTGDLNEGLKF